MRVKKDKHFRISVSDSCTPAVIDSTNKVQKNIFKIYEYDTHFLVKQILRTHVKNNVFIAYV